MDEDCFEADSSFQLNERATMHNARIDRMSELPNEILFLVLSFLPVRKAASTTVLSTRWLDLWKQIPNLKFNLKSDRISQLPDQILLAVFSFLTLTEAVATSVLSSRWLDLWKHNPYLDFDANYLYQDEDQIPHFVNSVIESHKALSLKQFRICFSVRKSAKSTVTKWLEFVFSRQVESLELDFSILYDSDMVVLEESLRETSITCGAPQTLSFCQSLKRLHLQSMKVGGPDVELFIRNCPMLKDLAITCSRLMSDINVSGTNLALKHLVISGCSGEKSLSISAPNLSSFRFTDTIGKLVFEYVPKLIEADLRSSHSEFFEQHIALISQLQILKMTHVDPNKVCYMNMFSQMPNLKKLFLYRYKNIDHGLLPVFELIWAFPRLEEFTFKFESITHPSALMEDATNVERSPHRHLKVLELQMYSQQTDHLVELVTYLSDHCVALGKIIIRREDVPRPEEFEADLEYLQQGLHGKIRSEIQLSLDSRPFMPTGVWNFEL